MSLLMNMLKEPAADPQAIDSPETTLERWNLIRNKPFLRKIYSDWYQLISNEVGNSSNPALEIGSGGGFMADHLSNLVTSDILELSVVDCQLDACAEFPFEDSSLRAITMVNVFHHLPDCEKFLEETTRCLEVGGKLVMVEPWITPWSNLIYSKLHHEPCVPDSQDWRFESSGPLSGANGALPWIVFQRDRHLFQKLYPQLTVKKTKLIMPFRYLFSGGLSMRALAPVWSYPLISGFEQALDPIMDKLAMFALIVVERKA